MNFKRMRCFRRLQRVIRAAVENRLPITAPVSDAMWSAEQRRDAQLPREINTAFARAAQEWQAMPGNAGKNINSPVVTVVAGG